MQLAPGGTTIRTLYLPASGVPYVPHRVPWHRRFRTARKIFTDCSEAQAASLPAEVREAASLRGGDHAAGLPRFLVVSVNMPAYSGPAPDGPTLKFVVYFAVPPSLAAEPSGAARLLRAFLSGAASGHRAPGGEFYDRFKVCNGNVTVM